MTSKSIKIGKRDRTALAAEAATMNNQTRKKTAAKNGSQKMTYNVTTQNRYGQLGNNKNISELTSNEKAIKIRPPAPITVTEKCETIDEILQPIEVLYRKKIISIGVRVYTDNANDKAAIEAQLISKNVGFFSHPDLKEKIFKTVLSGLPDIDVTEIEKSLLENYNIKPIKILKIGNNSNKLYLVHFKNDEINMSNLKNMTVIYKHIIRWLPYKPKRNGPTQCYKCLMYGHGASHCHRAQKCLLCGASHKPDECPNRDKKSNDNTANPSTFKCYNCANNNLPHKHKASDSKCPFRERYVQIRANITTKQNRKKPIIYNNNRPAPVPPPQYQSYAATLQRTGSNVHTQQATSESLFETSNNNNNTTFTDGELWSLTEVTQLLMQSINQLSKCRTKLDQLNIITNLIQHALGK